MATFSVEAFETDIKIDDLDLDVAFREQASLYAHYAVLYRDAQRVAGAKKINLDVTRSEIDKSIRDAAATAGTKLTQAQIDAEIDRDKRYIQARLASIDASASEKLLANTLEAFGQRKDMLVQLGAQHRKEMEGPLHMMASKNRLS